MFTWQADLCPGPAAAAGSPPGAQDRRSSGHAACSRRGRPAEQAAHPAARRGQGDPQRIADHGQEQAGSYWPYGRRANRPVSVLDNGWPPVSGDAAHPPHHVPVHWLPGHQDHRGENDGQRPRAKGNGRLGDGPCSPHLVRIDRPRGYRQMAGSIRQRSAGRNRIKMAVRDQQSHDTARGLPTPDPPIGIGCPQDQSADDTAHNWSSVSGTLSDVP